MMTFITLILLAAVILPLLFIVILFSLEILADVLFFIVKVIDLITGIRTESRIKIDKDNDNGLR